MLENSREVLHGCFNDVSLCFRTTRFLLWSHFMLFRVPLNDCRSAASDGCFSSTATSSLRSQSNWQSKRRNASSAKGLTLAFFRRSTGVKRGTNKLKQTTREKLWKHESIKENQRLKWWKKHQHAQRKTTSSYFGASTKTLRIHESMSQSIENRTPNKFHFIQHCRTSGNWGPQSVKSLMPCALSRWLLSKGSPLLQRAILGEKLTLSWGHYVIPFWVQMKKR